MVNQKTKIQGKELKTYKFTDEEIEIISTVMTFGRDWYFKNQMKSLDENNQTMFDYYKDKNDKMYRIMKKISDIDHNNFMKRLHKGR